MNKKNPNVATNAEELCEILGLPKAEARLWELRLELTDQILVNNGDASVSIDFLMKLLWAVGQDVKFSFKKAG